MGLFDTKIERVRFADESYYKMGTDQNEQDIYYPSATFVLNWHPKGYGYSQWLKDVGENAKQIMERAAESGTLVHNAIDSFLKGNEITWEDNLYGKQEWKGICRFMEFYEMFKPKIVANEMQVFSNKHKYAGTLDLICDIAEERWLIDFKFSNSIWDTHYFQIAAYAVAFDEMVVKDIPKIDRIGVLHLKAATRTKDVFESDKKHSPDVLDKAVHAYLIRKCSI